MTIDNRTRSIGQHWMRVGREWWIPDCLHAFYKAGWNNPRPQKKIRLATNSPSDSAGPSSVRG